MKRFRKSEGFTLIELLIVIIIIGILAAIAIPMFLGQRDKAKESAVKEGVHSIQVGVQSYAVDNDDAYPADGARERRPLGAPTSTTGRRTRGPSAPMVDNAGGQGNYHVRRNRRRHVHARSGSARARTASSPSRDLSSRLTQASDARGGCAGSRPGRFSWPSRWLRTAPA